MTNTQLFDQPFRLTIRSSDGKPIDCIQSNSSYEISVSCFSRVTVSFESTHLNTNFTASHIVNNFRDSTNPSYQSTDSGTVDGLGASIHPVKFDKQPGLFCTRDKSCGHNVTYPTNLEFGQSSRCASLSEPAVTSCSSVFGRDSVIGESFNLQDKQSALRGNNQDSDSNLSLDFDYDSTSDSSSDIEEKSKNQRQSNKVESFKVDVQKNGSVDQFSLTTGRLIDDPLLLLQPKVHILKLPDFIVDSNESASKKDEIYSNLTEEIFKTDIDFVHRHVNGSTQNNDSDSDEDSFPFNLNAGFQPIKRNPFSLNFVSESGDEDNGNAESQRPKVNRKLRNYCFKRKRQISTDDSSEDSDSDTPSLELQIDDDDDDADLIGMEQVITKDDSKAEKNEEPSRNGLKMSLGSDDEITNGIIKRRRLDLFEGVVVETVEENRDYGENSVDKVANRRLSFNVDNSSEGYNSNDFSIGEIDEQELVPKYRKIESRKKTLPTNTDEVSKMALEEGFSTSSLKKAKTNRQKRTKISTSLKRNLFGDNEHQSAGSISPDHELTLPPTESVLTSAELEEEASNANYLESKRIDILAMQERKYEQLRSVMGENKKRLILDSYDNGNVRVEVDSILVSELKSHQIEGIKFLYKSTIENVDNLRDGDEGSGCILAHCMGLGKTFQVIAFVHTILSNSFTKNLIKTVLIAVPVNVLKSWVEEFDKWIIKRGLKSFEIYEINEIESRLDRLDRWKKEGGVLIIGHTLLGNLLNLRDPKKKVLSSHLNLVEKHLANPGPDLIIIDEGHVLKSPSNLLCKGVMGMKTRRKIILTGTPLQNNLDEYHTMISIIKPQLLGSKQYFTNQFRNPIEKGQKADSSDEEFRLMKEKESVLHKLLSGSIQRFGFDTLKPFVESKMEYALYIRPTQTIAEMYNFFLDGVQERRHLIHSKYLRFLVNHPAVLHLHEAKKLVKSNASPRDNSKLIETSTKFVLTSEDAEIGNTSLEKDWYKQFVGDDDWYDFNLSCKIVMLFKILSECISAGDKLVVTSQSIETLDLIEKLMAPFKLWLNDSQNQMSWEFGKNYFRIDGTVNPCERLEQVHKFNDPENKEARLFLLSTKAGGIGINLTGANRCIIFDVSWNPSDDIQAIFRVYRLGQDKPVYVYRFVTKDTMEEQIFRKQVVKLGMAIRVVDKQQVKRASATCDPDEFYDTRPLNEYQILLSDVPKDRLLANLLHSNNNEVLECIELDSLLEKKPEEELTEEERQRAWTEYENNREAEIQAKEAEVTDAGKELAQNVDYQEPSTSYQEKISENQPIFEQRNEESEVSVDSQFTLDSESNNQTPSDTVKIISISQDTSTSKSSASSTIPTRGHFPTTSSPLIPKLTESILISSTCNKPIETDFDALKHYKLSDLDVAYFFNPSKLMVKMYNFFLDQAQKDRNHLFSHANYLRSFLNHPAVYQFQDISSQYDDQSAIEGTSLKSDWYQKFLQPDDFLEIDSSGKFVELFKIIELCISVNQRLLVYCLSTETLDLIEFALDSFQKDKLGIGLIGPLIWRPEKDYFRIDSATCIKDRIDQIKHFNDPENKEARLFLLGTNDLAKNCINADQVIIFDFSLDLSEDIETIWCTPWLKSTKTANVYRFVTKDTMEEQIFNKQMLRFGMAIGAFSEQQVDKFSIIYEPDQFYNHRPKDNNQHVIAQIFTCSSLLSCMFKRTLNSPSPSPSPPPSFPVPVSSPATSSQPPMSIDFTKKTISAPIQFETAGLSNINEQQTNSSTTIIHKLPNHSSSHKQPTQTLKLDPLNIYDNDRKYLSTRVSNNKLLNLLSDSIEQTRDLSPTPLPTATTSNSRPERVLLSSETTAGPSTSSEARAKNLTNSNNENKMDFDPWTEEWTWAASWYRGPSETNLRNQTDLTEEWDVSRSEVRSIRKKVQTNLQTNRLDVSQVFVPVEIILKVFHTRINKWLVGIELEKVFESMYREIDKTRYKILRFKRENDFIKIQIADFNIRLKCLNHFKQLNRTDRFHHIRFRAIIPNLRLPLIKFQSKNKIFTNKKVYEGIQSLRRWNHWDDNWTVRLKSSVPKSEGEKIFLIVDPNIRDQINRENGTISLRDYRVPIEDEFGLTQCFKCLDYVRHKVQVCPLPIHVNRCRYCAGNHYYKACRHKKNVKKWFCRFCKVKGHSTISINCPVLIDQLRPMLMAIGYKYNYIYLGSERLNVQMAE